MPKEKTFWVIRYDAFSGYSLYLKRNAHTSSYIHPSEGKQLFPKLKFGELKQFKIVEVKHGTKK